MLYFCTTRDRVVDLMGGLRVCCPRLWTSRGHQKWGAEIGESRETLREKHAEKKHHVLRRAVSIVGACASISYLFFMMQPKASFLLKAKVTYRSRWAIGSPHRL